MKSLATFNDWPFTYRTLAAGYAYLGCMDDAAAAIRRLREIALVPGLRKAGLPER